VTHRPSTGDRDDQGSIILALLVTLIGVSLSALLVPMVLSQVQGTRENEHRVASLAAAQAGLDIAIGHVRASEDTGGNGALSTLPCGPLAGDVSAGGPSRYQVSIDYFSADPQGKTDAWIAANRLTCISGGGTQKTPAYALLRSYGTDIPTGDITTVQNRFLKGTYTFQTTNQNIAGGLIHVYKTATSTDLCFDAGSTSPGSGTYLRMQPCVTGSGQQTFAYNTNLTLALVNSKTPSLPLGMCLDAGSPHAVGNYVVFQPCATTTQPRQQWSINDSSNLEGTSNGTSLDGYCFNVQTQNTAGSYVVLSTSNCHKGYDTQETFQLEATTGAGAAGSANSQLVNFSEFGRCLDVTEQNVNYAYMIAWPCKQAPNPANVTWNQKWALPAIVAPATSATGKVTTSPTAVTPYCLQSPGSTAAGSYVKVVLCSLMVTGAPSITWTVYADTGVYESSYRLKDGYGYCLQATDPSVSSPDFYPSGNRISKLIVATCGGSTLQKWNAPPNILQSTPLKDIGEK
jgi:Ricin-type beta-trefoil lectin domain